jgi:hypothetical protein
MNQITIQSALSDQLARVPGDVVICDSTGRALGFFSPLPDSTRIEDLQLEPPLSIAETEALRKDRTGKPLEEILGRLGLQ